MTQSTFASLGVSKHLSDLSSRGATEVLQKMTSQEIQDPVLRYSNFMTSLIQREFSVAKAKRDGLSIVRLANTSMPNIGFSSPLKGDPFK